MHITCSHTSCSVNQEDNFFSARGFKGRCTVSLSANAKRKSSNAEPSSENSFSFPIWKQRLSSFSGMDPKFNLYMFAVAVNGVCWIRTHFLLGRCSFTVKCFILKVQVGTWHRLDIVVHRMCGIIRHHKGFMTNEVIYLFFWTYFVLLC